MSAREIIARAAAGVGKGEQHEYVFADHAAYDYWLKRADAILAALREGGWAVVHRGGVQALIDRLTEFPSCVSGCNTLKVCACATIDDAAEMARAMIAAAEEEQP